MTIMNEIVGESGEPGAPGCFMTAAAVLAGTLVLVVVLMALLVPFA